jgi:outer membrane protein insertion porin family
VGQVRAQRSVRVVVAILVGWIAFAWVFGGAAWRPAQAQQPVGQIVIEGNQRVESATVRSYMAIAAGEVATATAVDRSLKALFATGLFSDVSIRQEGSNLVVTVVENPIINRLAFEGNRRLDDKALEAEVQLRPRIVYTRARVQNDVQRIVQLYRRSGRFAATVEPKVIQLPQNRVDLVFEINEGPVTDIRRINFVGNRVFSDRTLRGVVATKESAFYRFLSATDNYDPDRLNFYRELLRQYYLARGYADFRVISAVAELAPERDYFILTFSVEEGVQYRVRSIEIDSKLRDLPTSQLMGLVKLKPGAIYSAEQVEQAIQAMTFEIGKLGYAFIDIRPRLNVDRDRTLIDVTFEINEGPRVYIERINISGNVRTLDSVVRREFTLAEGDAFNTAKLRQSQRRVRALGYFKKVDVKQDQGSSPDRSVVSVEIEEQSTGELTFGIGFSSSDGPLAELSVRERNLLGRGQDLRASIQASGRRQEVDLSFTEPFFLDRNVAAGFDIFRKTTDRLNLTSFDSSEVGFALRATYPLSENLRQRFTYTLRQDEISDIGPNASRFIRRQAGSDITSAVGHSLIYDIRDDRFNPKEGYRVSLDQTLAGLGGTKSYLRNVLNYEYHYPFLDDVIGSFQISEGYVFGIGENTKITDRFFLGGNNLKGFRPGGVGPRDRATGDSLGGKLFAVTTGEVKFPIGLPKELNVAGVAFTQAGTLAQSDESGAGLFDVGSLRLSTGVGLAWRSPFGPVRVDYAQALRKEELDKTRKFFFSFGARF